MRLGVGVGVGVGVGEEEQEEEGEEGEEQARVRLDDDELKQPEQQHARALLVAVDLPSARALARLAGAHALRSGAPRARPPPGAVPLFDVEILPAARVRALAALPAHWRSAPLVVFACAAGLAAPSVAAHVRTALGHAGAVALRGGLDGWLTDLVSVQHLQQPHAGEEDDGAASAQPVSGTIRLLERRLARAGTLFAPPLGLADVLVVRPSLLAQTLQVLTGFVGKTVYTIGALAAAWWLWRARAPDLAALRRALLAFFVGEECCAVNFLLFGEESAVLEHAHSLGMLLAVGLLVHAGLVLVDTRLGAVKACARLTACHGCADPRARDAAGRCALERLLLTAVLPALAGAAALLLAAEPEVAVARGDVLGMPYLFRHGFVHQLVETRLCPALALALFAAAAAVLLLLDPGDPAPPAPAVGVVAPPPQRLHAARALTAAGCGPLGFGLMRSALFALFREERLLVWFVVGEEVSELLAVVGILAFLVVGRSGLALPRPELPFLPAGALRAFSPRPRTHRDARTRAADAAVETRCRKRELAW